MGLSPRSPDDQVLGLCAGWLGAGDSLETLEIDAIKAERMKAVVRSDAFVEGQLLIIEQRNGCHEFDVIAFGDAPKRYLPRDGLGATDGPEGIRHFVENNPCQNKA